jgi:hypothetical protein
MANDALLREWIAGFELKHGVKPSPQMEDAMREQMNRVPEREPWSGLHAKAVGPTPPTITTHQEMRKWHDDRAERINEHRKKLGRPIHIEKHPMGTVASPSNPDTDSTEIVEGLGVTRKEFYAVGSLADEILQHLVGKRSTTGAIKQWGWLIPRLAKLIRDSK